MGITLGYYSYTHEPSGAWKKMEFFSTPVAVAAKIEMCVKYGMEC